jgi:hypothetical protein
MELDLSGPNSTKLSKVEYGISNREDRVSVRVNEMESTSRTHPAHPDIGSVLKGCERNRGILPP